ncbi:MAG: hypothetical protein OEX04_03225 [Acidimicrobiia bacterium]|nr:hypothetical protein [Acidimicrobiia bacterium]MDH4306467.1 hypothetical protein [Acidimicrobiia bacterium]
MSRLKRFEDFRFVGARDTMLVYDTDDEAQAEELAIRAEAEDLWGKNLLQSFAPDVLEEAANRGFRAVRRAAG